MTWIEFVKPPADRFTGEAKSPPSGYIRRVSRDPARWDPDAWITYDQKNDDNDWRHLYEGKWITDEREKLEPFFAFEHPWINKVSREQACGCVNPPNVEDLL